MMHQLCLSAGQASSLERRARAASPYECCGAVLGCTRGGVTVAAHILPLTNSDRRASRFSIADTHLRWARRVAAELRLDLVAIYHSHSGSAAVLSRDDRESLEYSSYPWIIIGFGPGGDVDIQAYAAGPGTPIPVQIAARVGPPLTSGRPPGVVNLRCGVE